MDTAARLTSARQSLATAEALLAQSEANHRMRPGYLTAAKAASDQANVWALEARIRRLEALAA